MTRKILIAMVNIMVLLFLGNAAFAEDVPGVTDNAIVIGVNGWFSGAGAALTVPIRDGIMLRAEEINKAGGIYGRKITIIHEDTGPSPARALAILRRFIEKDKVFSTMGANITDNMRVMLPVITEAKLPHMEMLTSTTWVMNPFNKYFFRPSVNHWYEAWTKVDFAVKELKAKRIAYYHNTAEWGKETAKGGLIRLKEAYGLEPVAVVEGKVGAKDVRAQILELIKAKPDVVLITDWPGTMMVFLRQAKELGLEASFVIAAPFGGDFTKAAGDLIEGVYGEQIPIILEDGDAPEMVKLREKFWEAYPDIRKVGRPQVMDLLGYVGMQVVEEGLRKAGKDLTRDKYIAALESLRNFDTKFLPALTFTPTSHEAFDNFGIWKGMKGGKRMLMKERWGNRKLLEECLDRSLSAYKGELSKEYLDQIKKH